MSDNKTRIVLHLLLCAVAAATLVGCVLQPGNNDSSSVTPTLTTGEPTAASADLFSQPVVYNSPAVATAGAVSFSHNSHVNGHGATQECAGCHPSPWTLPTAGNLAVQANFTARTAPKMADMYAGGFCAKCHDGTIAFSVKDSCSKCHPNISANGPTVVFPVPGMGNVTFSHDKHVYTYGKTCYDCHDNATPWDMKFETGKFPAPHQAGAGCAKCHTGASGQGFAIAGNCGRCHGN